MRDMVACFSEHAVRVSETTCSNHHLQLLSQNTTAINSAAVQTAVCLVYKIKLSTSKTVLVTVTWSSATMVSPQCLTISFSSDHSTTTFKLNTTSRLFRKKKGSRTVDHGDDKIDLFWDLSEVNYESGAEPINGYYILIMMESEIGLVLGDLCNELSSKKMKNGAFMLKSCLVSRKEHYSGTALYSTKAQFNDNGIKHEITVKCSSNGETQGIKQPVLTVYLDKRTVVRIKRLQWNFRGNQTIFIDGMLIDLFWDVHDWFFASGNGLAVFMFRRRIGIESRLWLEDKVTSTNKQDQESPEFSLTIYASKI